ncbi:helix-turn-helix domain-containing protein [Patescibacteria group bacterium]|nr:helix-turn-helix domain-containing protein [Patescibacteria group bacterium]
MSEALTINGKKLLPIKDVAVGTKYTRDYIAKLARDGQIVGALVGRQWFIDNSSLARFIETTELEAEVRNRHLSRERRREREVKTAIKNRFDIVASHPRYSARQGVLRAVTVVVCGVVAGYAFTVAPDLFSQTVALQKAQSSLSVNTVMVASPEVQHELPLSSIVIERPVFEDTHEARRFSEGAAGVLVLPAGSPEDPVVVAELFSDPVTVAYTAPGVGTVSLDSTTQLGSTSLSFVTVPVAAAAEVVRFENRTPMPSATP